jgi:hypothetical protein
MLANTVKQQRVCLCHNLPINGTATERDFCSAAWSALDKEDIMDGATLGNLVLPTAVGDKSEVSQEIKFHVVKAIQQQGINLGLLYGEV